MDFTQLIKTTVANLSEQFQWPAERRVYALRVEWPMIVLLIVLVMIFIVLTLWACRSPVGPEQQPSY